MSCITGMLAALRNGLFIWLDERRHNTSTGTVHDASEVRYLKTSSRTIFSHNTNVGGIDAGANEPGQVVELNVSHLDTKEGCLSVIKHLMRLTFPQCIEQGQSDGLHGLHYQG